MGFADTRVWREALAIALPLLLAESIDSILWIIDTYFVSGLGDEAIAAVGIGGYLSWLMFVGGSLFYMGSLVVVAQMLGAGDREGARRAVGEAMAANALLSLPLLALAWHYTPLMVDAIAGPETSPATRGMAIDYFRARLLGLPFTYSALALDAAYRGYGRTRPVLYSSLAYASFNAVLDPILIYGYLGAPALGVVGAGIASAAATVVYASSLLALAHRALGYTPTPRVPGRLAFLMARVGAPALVERLVFVGGNLAYLGVVARCGDAALAAHTIGVRIESLAFLPIFSIGEAAATLAGQAVGRGDVEAARRAGVEVAKLDFLAGVATGALIAGLSGVLPHAFTSDPAVLDLARLYLLIAAFTEPFFGVAISLTMAIRGAGNTTVPTIINLASLYTLRVLPASILPRYFEPCVLGAWTAMALDMVGRAVLSALVYRWFHRLARRLVGMN